METRATGPDRSPDEQITIRRADCADVSALQELSIATFTQTFGHLYAPEDLQYFLDTTYAPDALRALLTSSDCAVWIAWGAGALGGSDGTHVDPRADSSSHRAIGYVLAGPCSLPHPDVHPSDGEIKRLYVREGLQSSGLGTRLMTRAVNWLIKERDPDALWLGVWSRNRRAQRFYERFGFSHAGDYRFKVGRHRDHEYIFSRRLR